MALTRITKGVIKPNENYDTHNINSTGIVTAIGLDINGNGDISGNLNIGGVLTYEDVTSIDSVGIITAQQGIHVGAGVSAVGVGTFGGLNINGASTFTGDITISSSTPLLRLTDTDTSGPLNVDIESVSGDLYLDTGSVHRDVVISSVGRTNEVARFTGDGKVGIGTDNPASIFHLNSSSSAEVKLTLQNTGGTTAIYGNNDDIIMDADKYRIRNNDGSTEYIRITSAGLVGIGTVTPESGQLQVIGNGYHQINISANKTANANKTAGISFLNYEGNRTSVFQTYTSNSANTIYYGSADSSARGVQYHNFYVNASRTATTNHQLALRIDSSGRLLLNHGSSRAVANITAQVQLEGTTANASAISIVRNSASQYPPYLNFGKSRATSTGGTTIVNNNDSLGEIRFSGADGNDLTNHAASINAEVDGTPGNNVTPGRLIFSTTSSTGSDAVERLRITSSGIIQISQSAPQLQLKDSDGTNQLVQFMQSGGATYLDLRDNTSDGQLIIRGKGGDTATERLRIASDGQIKQTAASGDTIFTFKRSDTNTTGAVGVLNFAASDDHSVANIQVLGDGDNEGAHIVFKTTSAAASADPYNAATVERLRISSVGELTSTAAQANVATFTSNQTASTIYVKDTDGDGIFISGSSAYGHRIYTNTTEDLLLGTNSDEKLRITSAGDVSIGGLASPRAKLDIEDAGTGKDVILRVSADDNSPYAFVVGNDAHDTTSNRGLAMWIGGSKKHHIQARVSSTMSENQLEIEAYTINFQTGSSLNQDIFIDQSGRLIVGDTANRLVWGINPALQVNGTEWDDTCIALHNFGNNTRRPSLLFTKGRSGTIGNFGTGVNAGEGIGIIGWSAHDTTDAENLACYIQGISESAPTANNQYGAITFSTVNGGSSAYERLRINAAGNVMCSADESFSSTALHSNGNASFIARGDSGAWAAKLLCRHSQNDYAYLGFASQDGSENLCSIYGYRAGTSTGDMSFGTCNGANSAVERLRIKANGNIGIGDFGTNTIPQKLSVKGNMYFRQGDYITWNNGDNQIAGISGYHLSFKTYDGSTQKQRFKVEGGQWSRLFGRNRFDQEMPLVNTTGSIAHPDITTNSKTNLSAGWYTIAVNGGNRATGRFNLIDRQGSRHQSFTFYASHHYGGAREQNAINVMHAGGRHSGSPIQGLRIKAAGTYDGAMLQVYLGDSSNLVTASLDGANFNTNGWVMKDWIADGTDPGGLSDFNGVNNGGEAAYASLGQINGGGMSCDGNIVPAFDNSYSNLGTSSRRWVRVYAGDSTINTSDENLKQDITTLTTAEMNAAKRLSKLFVTYKWKKSVSEKGDKARTHTGIIAQRVKAEMVAAGLDPTKYSFYCEDDKYTMPDGTEVNLVDENITDAEVVSDSHVPSYVQPAGSIKSTIYSICYTELLAFIAAYNEQRFTSIEERLAALEAS